MTRPQNFAPPEIVQVLKNLPDDLAELALDVRSLILSVVPDSAEEIHTGWINYFHSGRGGPVSAGICQIGLFSDHIRLAFIHGIFLPDPERLLEGRAQYKRYVTLRSGRDVRWNTLADLIQASAQFDPKELHAP
jgi:hypothetical protein